MRLQILISTMHSKFMQRNIKPPAEYLVINQWLTEKPESNTQDNIFSYNEKGLAKSRNHAIDNSSSEISLISDDDLVYLDTIEETILEAFDKYKDADIITFQIKTPDKTPYKGYKSEVFWHTKKSLMSVSSVEIAFRRDSINSANIRFDERFGLGGDFPTGEEIIFLTDAFNKGLKILYIPKPIVIHPLESSGKNYDNEQLIEAKGAMFYRLFGLLGYAASLIFAYRKHTQSPHSFMQFFRLMNRGINNYRSTIK